MEPVSIGTGSGAQSRGPVARPGARDPAGLRWLQTRIQLVFQGIGAQAEVTWRLQKGGPYAYFRLLRKRVLTANPGRPGRRQDRPVLFHRSRKRVCRISRHPPDSLLFGRTRIRGSGAARRRSRSGTGSWPGGRTHGPGGIHPRTGRIRGLRRWPRPPGTGPGAYRPRRRPRPRWSGSGCRP